MIEDVSTYSFLFDSSDPSAPSWYGGLFDPAFLKALRSADANGITHSIIARGDLLLHFLSTKVTSVESTADRQSHTVGYNKNQIMTTIHDLVSCLKTNRSSFNFDNLERVLLSGHIAHCITVVRMRADIASAVNEELGWEDLYLGMAEVDRGNPIMKLLFDGYLIKDAGVSGSRIWLEADYAGDVHTVFEGAAEFNANGEGVLQLGGLTSMFQQTIDEGISESGAATLSRYQSKGRLTLQERIISLLSNRLSIGGGEAFRFDAISNEKIFEATVPPPKLTQYALDPLSEKGRGKAKFFNEVLGIFKEDWQFLLAQIHEGILTANLEDLSLKKWQGGSGVSFNAIINVIGKNGRNANIFTNWIMEADQIPRLSTLMPTEKSAQGPLAKHPSIVSAHLEGNDKWQAIYDLAHIAGMAAHDSVVPTPMFVVGYGGQQDGMCGFAFVHVPDARQGFARWLLKNKKAMNGYRSSVTISCPRKGQSVDRAYAYACAFAKVLDYNGVKYRIEKILD